MGKRFEEIKYIFTGDNSRLAMAIKDIMFRLNVYQATMSKAAKQQEKFMGTNKFKNMFQGLKDQLKKIPQLFDSVMKKLQSFAAKAKSAMSKVAKATSTVAQAFRRITQGSKDLGDKISLLGAKTGVLRGVMSALTGIAIGDFLAESAKSAIEFTENVNLFTVAMGDAVEEGNEFVLKMAEIYGMDPNNLYRTAGYFYQLTDAIGMTDEASAKISLSLTKMSNDIASLFNVDIETVTENMASGLQGMTRAVRKYGMDIRVSTLQTTAYKYGLSQNVEEMSEANRVALRYITMVEQANNAVHQMGTTLDGTNQVMGDFAKTIESPANQLRIFKEQISQLGRAIGNIFIAPLAKAIAYINGLIMAIRMIINFFTGFTGAISGSGNTADKSAGGFDNAAGSIGGVGDAADKAKKKLDNMLAPFDELNILQENMSDSDAGDMGLGGIGDGLDPALLKALEDLELQLENIRMKANQVRDAILDFLGFKVDMGQIVDFDKDKFMDNWFNKLPELARVWGAKLGHELTKAVAGIPWNMIGQVIGGGINAAIIFANSFIDNTNWDLIGRSIAKLINGAVYRIDWEGVGKLMAAKFKIAVGVLVGFISELDMSQLGQAIANMVNGFISTIIEVLETTDWLAVSTQLATLLNEAVSNINWYDIGKAIVLGFTTAIDMLIDFIRNVNFGEITSAISEFIKGMLDTFTKYVNSTDWNSVGRMIFEKIGEFLTGVDWSGVARSLMSALGSAIGAACSLLWGFIQEGWDLFVETFTAESEQAGLEQAHNFLYGFETVFLTIAEWLYTNVIEPFVNGLKSGFGIDGDKESSVTKKVGQSLGDGIKNGFNERRKAILKELGDFLKAVQDWYTKNVAPLFTAEFWMKQMQGIADGARAIVNRVIDAVERGVNFIVDALNSISWTVPDWVPGIGGQTWGFNLPHASIPRLATGGVVSSPTIAMVGEGKYDEAIIPLGDSPQLEELLNKFADRVPGGGEGGSTNPIEVRLFIGDKEWDTFTYESAKKGAELQGAEPIKIGG